VKRSGSLAVLALVAVMVIGCSGKNPDSVTLYAGAGLKPAVDDLATAFAAETGIEIYCDYSGSGIAITRAREDDAADLFMPGDVSYVDELHNRTKSVVSKTQVSWFVPVIIVQKGNPKKVTGLKDLFRKDLKVALGNPKFCQVGKISTKILEKNGLNRADLGEEIRQSDTVNQLGVWVKMETADAAIVWDAIAANIADSVDVVEIPKDKNIISHVVVGLLSTSKHPEKAKKFIDFMTGPTGQEILKKRGYRVEAPE